MKTIDHTVRNPLGLHARNVALLSRTAAQFQSEIYITVEERTENVKDIMAIMALRVTQRDHVCFLIEGNDESDAHAALQRFCREQL